MLVDFGGVKRDLSAIHILLREIYPMARRTFTSMNIAQDLTEVKTA